ncbi:UDP-N-acetylmuramoyl-L-alanyl-D-glutamate--2,6-diaminopimelate ligase [Spirochaeta thermophila DSM 6578]|uniref:UDP-N-acetylmuramyl-tripeptide synthetase n=1 Tax=Winmispira thermophila (strain ATCC 700085 / DSM 6578 / Z-1203) TaxID=869211 RepID=G0GCM0_WINT7|nr:UDP-N-acetylmuramoyl-L-alanyl-D-glutamate--2,6-diaminopimelate ligase [Spirochaeta thermophila DSM 6578]
MLDAIKPEEVRGEGDPPVRLLAYDSRDVESGALFFALPGLHTDGHRFVQDALERGAVAVVHERELPSYREGVVYLRVKNARRALSAASAVFYGHPSQDLEVIGVTGTDGKSSTTYFIYQLLRASGVKVGCISTALFSTGGEPEPNPLRQSTPEAPFVHGALARMREAGCTHAVVEATSHGLSPRTARLEDVRFTVGVLTNITHEHMEFHGSFEQYREDKGRLFRGLPEEGKAVLNLDDPSSGFLAERTRAGVWGYGLGAREGARLWAEVREESLAGSRCLVHGRETLEVWVPFPGRFNVENVLAAVLGAAAAAGKEPEGFLSHVPHLEGVPGRMERVEAGQPFLVLVDYAHTPGAFEKLLPFVRRFVEGRLIVVFGSAGERDRTKRPMQGRVASRWAEVVVLTDEDPRGEDRMAILREIAAGCEGLMEGESLFMVPDRREAIGLAVGMAREGDAVLCLGKGHERSIVTAEGPVAWDEVGAVREALAARGWREEQGL